MYQVYRRPYLVFIKVPRNKTFFFRSRRPNIRQGCLRGNCAVVTWFRPEHWSVGVFQANICTMLSCWINRTLRSFFRLPVPPSRFSFPPLPHPYHTDARDVIADVVGSFLSRLLRGGDSCVAEWHCCFCCCYCYWCCGYYDRNPRTSCSVRGEGGERGRGRRAR